MADRPMHVAIDGRELVGKPTGVGRYLSEVLRVWVTGASETRYSVIVPATVRSEFPDPGHRITWILEPSDAPGTWWEQTALTRAVNRLSPDVLFAPGYTAPLRVRAPIVLTVHDVSFFAHPEWFAAREGLRRRWLTRASARRARFVTTVSEFSKQEIVRWLKIQPDRIVVAPNGAPPADPDMMDERSPIVLFVGSLFNRRHIPELIQGFARAAERVPEARLVLVGDNRTTPRQDPVALARALGLGGRVDWHAWVDDERLSGYYRQAAVFAFLSEYEGFGLTPLEAIAHGVPPVVLDTPLSREVYGDGARRVGLAPESIGRALIELLTDAESRRAVLEAGRARLRRYPWESTAATLADTVRQAAGR